MKRRLNILCVIVVLVLSYSVLEGGYYFIVGAKAGVEAGIRAGSSVEQQKALTNMKYISLFPENLSIANSGELFLDSVYNAKSGAYVPVAYNSMMVSVDTKSTVWSQIAFSLLNFVHIGLCLWAIILFICLVISINKSDIFNWKNVRRLRLLGLALIVSFCAAFLSSYMTFVSVGKIFAVPGYDMSLSDLINTTTLVLGISTLIVAEVFAIGLKMKEEQDLTI